MSNVFANQTTEGYEEEQDRLGGGGTVASGVYDATVKLAYIGKSQSSNAQSVSIHLDLDGQSFEYRETVWVTNRDNENFYKDKNDASKKHALPGWNLIDSLCLLTTGYGLTDQEMEEKVVNLYDFEQRKELPRNVVCITPLHGEKITVAILETIEDKNVKDGSGKYVPSGDTRTENHIDKFFHAESGMTVSEIKAGKETGEFKEKWAEKNNGSKKDNSTKDASGAKTGAPGKPGGSGDGAAPKKSLFNK